MFVYDIMLHYNVYNEMHIETFGSSETFLYWTNWHVGTMEGLLTLVSVEKDSMYIRTCLHMYRGVSRPNILRG